MQEKTLETTVYVISDLHLGGANATIGNPGFQMCSRQSQDLLARWLHSLDDSRPTHLVINGDLVDFLAEEPFEAFTASETDALRKLNRILERTEPIWSALSAFAGRPHAELTILLGNHDVELSFPRVRRRLLGAVAAPSRAYRHVDFVYDNEALNLGSLLIEHGNRFDPWNAVPHDALRRFRSQVSRKLPADKSFTSLPGSNLVEKVINPIKRNYAFVDLLKPEEATVLPILAALGIGTSLSNAIEFSRQFWRKSKLTYTDEFEPQIPGFVAGDASGDGDTASLKLAQRIANGGLPGNVAGLRETVARMGDFMAEQLREARQEALYLTFQELRGQSQDAFDVGQERPRYLVPAKAALKRGYEAVAYGHTHHVKNIEVHPATEGSAPTRYLNSGTWADLMWVPSAVWGKDGDESRTALRSFVRDLEQGELGRWRKSMPTYLKVELREERVVGAGAFFADNGEPASTDGIVRRMNA